MATTDFVKNYKDEIIVYDYNKQDFAMLKRAGYEPDEDGGICVEMVFGDGIAYDTQMNGIVMRYPTLAEVEKSKVMQERIWDTTCRDDIIPFDIALAYGRVGRYKYVLNYNEWIMQGENETKEVYGIVDENDYNRHYFDCFEEDFLKMLDAGLIGNVAGSDYLTNHPSWRRVNQLAAKYGILWTEWIGTHIVKENGRLEKAA